jgi:hypothetical protein
MNDLKRQLLGMPEENPLEVIGFTQSVLDLGLSDEELYKYCRKSARSLMEMFHPDRVGSDSAAVERQRTFSEAFDQLKDQRIFDLALDEFKEKHSEERSETNADKQVISSLKGRIDTLPAIEKELAEARAGNLNITAQFINYLYGISLRMFSARPDWLARCAVIDTGKIAAISLMPKALHEAKRCGPPQEFESLYTEGKVQLHNVGVKEKRGEILPFELFDIQRGNLVVKKQYCRKILGCVPVGRMAINPRWGETSPPRSMNCDFLAQNIEPELYEFGLLVTGLPGRYSPNARINALALQAEIRNRNPFLAECLVLRIRPTLDGS